MKTNHFVAAIAMAVLAAPIAVCDRNAFNTRSLKTTCSK